MPVAGPPSAFLANGKDRPASMPVLLGDTLWLSMDALGPSWGGRLPGPSEGQFILDRAFGLSSPRHVAFTLGSLGFIRESGWLQVEAEM